MWPEDTRPGPDSPPVLEEDEAEMELQKQLEKGRKLRQIQQLKDSGEKVRALQGRAEAWPQVGQALVPLQREVGQNGAAVPSHRPPAPLSTFQPDPQGLVGPVG